MPEPRQNGPSLACIPCAKRKVRCDREAPSCSNCKRRKGDRCLYPITQTRAKDRSTADSRSRGTDTVGLRRGSASSTNSYLGGTSFEQLQYFKNHNTLSVPTIRDLNDYVPLERIRKLEEYVRSLGGDPDHGLPSAQAFTPAGQQFSISQHGFEPIAQLDHPNRTTSAPQTTHSETEQRPGIIVKEKRSIYVESPMWYSWSEANKHLTGQDDTTPGNDRDGFFETSGGDALLGQIQLPIDDPIYQHHPSPAKVLEIWQRYLQNVHPLTMMFFSWDKDPLIRKLAADPTRASKEEHAFLYAMYFLTILTVDEEDCTHILGGERAPLLDQFQHLTERTLLAAGFASTYDRLLLQAFLMYLLAMRNRARPNTLYSLGGVAIRIAERMGLHRDGSLLGLPPAEAEERRRIWWQLQHLEILIALLAGCIPLSLTAAWDTRLPANLDDADISQSMEQLPLEKNGLTSMSAVLCKYTFLQSRRANLGTPAIGMAPLYTPSAAEREREYEAVESLFRLKFLQYCEPLEPLHAYIQISVRCVLMAYRRTLDQPRVKQDKLSDMSIEDRDRFLRTCMKCLEYNILLFTKEEIKGFRWQAENYFQWTAFVYILIEAHHRSSDPSWSKLIWDLISRIYDAHVEFAKRVCEKELFKSFGRMVLGAWKPHYENIRSNAGVQEVRVPWYIKELEQQLPKSKRLTSDEDATTEITDTATQEDTLAAYHTTNEHCLGFVGGWNPGAGDELWDLNMIDWSFWESSGERIGRTLSSMTT